MNSQLNKAGDEKSENNVIYNSDVDTSLFYKKNLVFMKLWFDLSLFSNQVFNENQVNVMLKSAAGVRAGVNFWFPLNNFSLLWPIDTKHAAKGSLYQEAA